MTNTKPPQPQQVKLWIEKRIEWTTEHLIDALEDLQKGNFFNMDHTLESIAKNTGMIEGYKLAVTVLDGASTKKSILDKIEDEMKWPSQRLHGTLSQMNDLRSQMDFIKWRSALEGFDLAMAYMAE